MAANVKLRTLAIFTTGLLLGGDLLSQRLPEERAPRVLKLWLNQYRKGKWDLRLSIDVAPRSLAKQHKLLDLPVGTPLPRFNRLGELSRILALVRTLETPAAMALVLEVAAAGYDNVYKYKPEMAALRVRTVAQWHAQRFTDPAVLRFLAQTADGKLDAFARGLRIPIRRAALRAQGNIPAGAGDAERRQILVRCLDAEPAEVRRAAADALGNFADPSTVLALARRLTREKDSSTILHLADAVVAIHKHAGNKLRPTQARMATLSATQALGRSKRWQADIALVDLLARFPQRESVPALIAFLERFDKEPRLVALGRLGRRLRIRVHEVLMTLTQRSYRIDQPARWRAFWESEGEKFTLPESRPSSATAKDAAPGQFFGMRVRGERVVFVIDVSGSMAQPAEPHQVKKPNKRGPPTGPPPEPGPESGPVRPPAAGPNPYARFGNSKLALAKRELLRAVQPLSEDISVSVLFYATGVGAWKPKLLPADANNKKRLNKWLTTQWPSGWTNIYDALKMALELRAERSGERYATGVDEIFLLSDGVPNRGEVVDPAEILALVREQNRDRRVRINTVYLGSPDDVTDPRRIGQKLMRQLARQNGGRFVLP